MKKLILIILIASNFLNAQTRIKFSQIENPATSSVNLGANTFSAGTIIGSSVRTSSLFGSSSASGSLVINATSSSTPGIIKFNTQLLPTATSTLYAQMGAQKLLIGDVTLNNQPTWIEFFKGNGSSAAQTARWGVGCLGAPEMNLFMNIDYTGGTHRYYDPTIPAIWSYMSHNNGFGLQYVPANNTNTVDIYTNFGCDPFKVTLFGQPATGKGINGFSTVTAAQWSIPDFTNTASTTGTPGLINMSAGTFSFTGAIGSRFLHTAPSGQEVYNSGTTAQTNLKLNASFTAPLSNCGNLNFVYGTNTGYNIGSYNEALNANMSIGNVAKSITAKASGTNIAVIGVASNTNASSSIEIGGFFALRSATTPTFASSAAIIADNTGGSNSVQIWQVNGTKKISVDANGVLKFDANNSTGAGSAALGTNCPAVTPTAPYTWIQVTTSDGSTGYIPVWK